MNLENIEIKEKIYIIQPILSDSFESSHEEAISLIQSAEAEYIGTSFQKIREITPSTFIGLGKLNEIRNHLSGLNDITVLFNGDLSPSQTLNISAALDNIKVIDRTTLILDIFALRAKTSEGKLQVELAQLKYIYPRLKGKGADLSRLGGGIGTRGPGETQLETDRRHIRLRIKFLEKKLSELKLRRKQLSDRRMKNQQRTISLVGYTNVGKSTLLNLLTEADVYVENKLFATLDPTTRNMILDDKQFLLTDTVGFLQNLPHDLIEAFHSTLESAVNSDLLLIVCDATGDYDMQLATTLETIKELNCTTPYLIVMNKCEKISDFDKFPPNSIFISAKTGMGIESLKAKILNHFKATLREMRLSIPYSKMSEYSLLKKYLTEKSFTYFDDHIEIFAETDTSYLHLFQKFRINPD